MQDLPFHDRPQAGQILSRKLRAYAGRSDLLVFGLPRGGVPVAFEVARALRAPLDIFMVRKLGAPGQEELAMGAIATGGVRIINEDVVRSLDISPRTIDSVAAKESRELVRRERLYRGDKPVPEMAGRTIILVDDGLATGSTMRAAMAAIRAKKPRRIVVAVPVAAAPTEAEFRAEADEIVCIATPEPFFSVGFWYEDFSQTSDEEIRDLLERAAKEPSPAA